MAEQEQKLCGLCKKKPVGPNGWVCDECYKSAEYQEKANIVLMGSEKEDWGIVLLTPGTVNNVPADSELVGTWHRWGEGTCWVSLTIPLTALMDRATLMHAEVYRRRDEGLDLMGSKPGRKARSAKPKRKEEVPEKDTTSETLQTLRDKLRPKA